MTKKQLNMLLKNVDDNEEVRFYVMDAEYKHDDSNEGLYDMGEARLMDVEKSNLDGVIWITFYVKGA